MSPTNIQPIGTPANHVYSQQVLPRLNCLGFGGVALERTLKRPTVFILSFVKWSDYTFNLQTLNIFQKESLNSGVRISK